MSYFNIFKRHDRRPASLVIAGLLISGTVSAQAPSHAIESPATGVPCDCSTPATTSGSAPMGSSVPCGQVSQPVQVYSQGYCGAPSGTSGMSFDLNVMLTGQVNSLQETVDKMTAEQESLAAAKTELETLVAQLREQLTTAEAQAEAQVAKMEAMTTEMETLKTAKSAIESEKEALAKQVAERDQRIAKLQAEMETATALATKQVQDLSAELAAAQKAAEEATAPPAEENPAPEPPPARSEEEEEAAEDAPAEDPPAEDVPAEDTLVGDSTGK
ncbi:hypothetical protein SH139x_003982 [Planctomycetaceae bacterium SH139]